MPSRISVPPTPPKKVEPKPSRPFPVSVPRTVEVEEDELDEDDEDDDED